MWDDDVTLALNSDLARNVASNVIIINVYKRIGTHPIEISVVYRMSER